MGVWIETQRRMAVVDGPKSHPVWVCGLKHQSLGKYPRDKQVTPCMGVWIETYSLNPFCRPISVTPCMGVWIETPHPNLW